MLDFDLIYKITHSFYEKAVGDIFIGYHFRVIEDFNQHIPRIARFWLLQLNGEIKDKNDLPYKLLEVHQKLPLKRGEINRWEVLFTETLEEFKKSKKINDIQYQQWLDKIASMKEKITQQALR